MRRQWHAVRLAVSGRFRSVLREELENIRVGGCDDTTCGVNAVKMVEAGGIEPPSENRRAVATTRLFRDLISPPQRPRTGCDAASHFVFRDCAQVADGVSLAH
jgi:hypothetical protein